MRKLSFIRRWTLANTIGMLVSYLVYTPIAHGITGGHERHLTSPQVIAHGIGHIVIALIIFLSQRKVLKEYFHISSTRIILSIITFLAMFWFGYYQKLIPGGLDTDILFGYLALGSGMWIGAIPAKGHWLAVVIAILSFPFASFIGELLLLIVVTTFSIKLDLHYNMFHHTIFWLSVGVTTGLLGGWIGGMALSRILFPKGS